MMTSHTTTRRSPIHAFAIATCLLLTTVFSAGSASASTLIPTVDTGGPGGGGGAASTFAPYAGSALQRSVELTESREPGTVTVAYNPPTASGPNVSIF